MAFWETSLKSPGCKVLRVTQFNKQIVIDLLKREGRTPVTKLFYGDDWFFVPDSLCDLVQTEVTARIAEADARRQASYPQGPEPDGANLEVYFPGEHDVAERIARDSGFRVETSMRNQKYVAYDHVGQIRAALEQRKAEIKAAGNRSISHTEA